jgi:hypothetical protein
MNRNSLPSRRSTDSRCAVCNHPDREAIDRDLMLGVRSQAEIAELVGVHASSVSRHYRRHAQPQLAMAFATETSGIALGDLVAEHDRLHGISLEVLVRALADGDLRLARDMIAEIRKLLVVITDLQKAIGAGTIRDADERQPFDLEAVRATFQEKLDDLADSYKRAPSIFEMVDAVEAGADQEEIDRLVDKASRPPETPSTPDAEDEVA